MRSVKNISWDITVVAIVLATILSACLNDPKTNKNQEIITLESEGGEHDIDTGEKAEGEEDGTQFGLDDVYDVVRNGAHLVLSYDAETNSFKGTVENATTEILESVRVEVHLSNGIELGPTTPANLKPGEKISVRLAATEKEFASWSAHAEVGSNENGESHEGEEEHGHSGEGDREHDNEGGSEHE